jgi:hypothetical protein
MSENQAVKVVRAADKAALGFSRIDVLALSWDVVKWLDHHRTNKALKINAALKERLYIAQIECSYFKVLIQGLKDEELELRIADLEEKLKEGILIDRDNRTSLEKKLDAAKERRP